MDICEVKAKGGMCENPFGGHFRLSNLDIQEWAGGRCQPEELLFRGVILEAASSYLFFGLGKNGMVADEFLWASDYFFNITSDAPETWNPDRKVRVSDIDNCATRKKQQYIDLTASQMQEMCFDQQYPLSGLDRSMSISRFRKLLKDKRRNIIEANFQQVSDYIMTLRKLSAAKGEYLRPGMYHGDLLETLVSPTDEALASLLYPLRQIQQVAHRSPFRLPRRVHGHRQFVYADRVTKIQLP